VVEFIDKVIAGGSTYKYKERGSE